MLDWVQPLRTAKFRSARSNRRLEFLLPIREVSKSDSDIGESQITDLLLVDQIQIALQPRELFPVVVRFVSSLQLQIIAGEKLLDSDRLVLLVHQLDFLLHYSPESAGRCSLVALVESLVQQIPAVDAFESSPGIEELG